MKYCFCIYYNLPACTDTLSHICKNDLYGEVRQQYFLSLSKIYVAELFALAESYSSTSIAGAASKGYYTFYGAYAYVAALVGGIDARQARIFVLAFLAVVLAGWLLITHPMGSRSEQGDGGMSFGQRATAVVMLVAFVSVNCGTGNVPNSIPTNLADNSGNIISALYTGLPEGTVYYSHNHLGSGALVTDTNGGEIFRITYTEYGEIDLHNSGKYNPETGKIEHALTGSAQATDAALIAITAVKFTGQEYDPETGFYYYNARYYDPQLGIFTTADTEIPDYRDGQSYNRHMYVRGNPIIYTDPTGHFFWVVVAIVAAVIGGIVAGTGGNIKGWLKGDVKFDWDKAWRGALVGALAGATGAWAAGAMATALGGSAAVSASLGATMTVGAVSGGAAGFVGGAMGTWLNGGSFLDGFAAGIIGMAIGAVAGAATAGLAYGAGKAWDAMFGDVDDLAGATEGNTVEVSNHQQDSTYSEYNDNLLGQGSSNGQLDPTTDTARLGKINSISKNLARPENSIIQNQPKVVTNEIGRIYKFASQLAESDLKASILHANKSAYSAWSRYLQSSGTISLRALDTFRSRMLEIKNLTNPWRAAQRFMIPF